MTQLLLYAQSSRLKQRNSRISIVQTLLLNFLISNASLVDEFHQNSSELNFSPHRLHLHRSIAILQNSLRTTPQPIPNRTLAWHLNSSSTTAHCNSRDPISDKLIFRRCPNLFSPNYFKPSMPGRPHGLKKQYGHWHPALTIKGYTLFIPPVDWHNIRLPSNNKTLRLHKILKKRRIEHSSPHHGIFSML